MKAVIFSCSMKDGKFSSTRGWCEHLQTKLNEADIQSELVILKDFDHEAQDKSNRPDELHQQMAKCYDADLIFFGVPINCKNITLSSRNLLDRFNYADTKGKQKGLDIFKDKWFEFCVVFGNEFWNNKYANQLWTRLPQTANRVGAVTYDARTHGTKQAPEGDQGTFPLHFTTWNSCDNEKTNLQPDTLYKETNLNKDIDELIKKFKSVATEHKTPEFSLEEFMDCFHNKEANAFGRGMTLAVDNINQETVKQHIKWLNEESGFTVYQRSQILVLMKERSIKADKYFESEKYFEEQFRLVEKGQVIKSDDDTKESYIKGGNRVSGDSQVQITFKPKSDPNSYIGTRSANFRPNNY